MDRFTLGLTFLVIVPLISGVEIKCTYEMSDWAAAAGTKYSCDAIVTSLDNPSAFTDVTGTHMAGKTNVDVKGFGLNFQKTLTKIPDGIENFFPHLEGFVWHGGNLETIDSSTFKPFSNLQAIGLAANKIVTIDGNLFEGTTKLQSIALADNLIQHVGEGLLTGLTDLMYVYFYSNPCINRNAFTPQEHQELNLQLPILCPPLAPAPKPADCLSMTSEMGQEIKKMIVAMEQRIMARTEEFRVPTECPTRTCKCECK